MMLSEACQSKLCATCTLYIVYLFSHVELEKEEKTRADDDRTSVTLRRLMGLFMTFFCNENPTFFLATCLLSSESPRPGKKGYDKWSLRC